jgi:hypothetical protein
MAGAVHGADHFCRLDGQIYGRKWLLGLLDIYEAAPIC